uniref:Uncharacterized protein n=1 Tax=Anopheles atroparvus TaxID=41427 RepID=A0A182IKG5_ANOAO
MRRRPPNETPLHVENQRDPAQAPLPGKQEMPPGPEEETSTKRASIHRCKIPAQIPSGLLQGWRSRCDKRTKIEIQRSCNASMMIFDTPHPPTTEAAFLEAYCSTNRRNGSSNEVNLAEKRAPRGPGNEWVGTNERTSAPEPIDERKPPVARGLKATETTEMENASASGGVKRMEAPGNPGGSGAPGGVYLQCKPGHSVPCGGGKVEGLTTWPTIGTAVYKNQVIRANLGEESEKRHCFVPATPMLFFRRSHRSSASGTGNLCGALNIQYA